MQLKYLLRQHLQHTDAWLHTPYQVIDETKDEGRRRRLSQLPLGRLQPVLQGGLRTHEPLQAGLKRARQSLGQEIVDITPRLRRFDMPLY